MNKSYLDNGKVIFVTNEYGDIEKRERTTLLEKIFVQENVIEEIQSHCEEINKSYDYWDEIKRNDMQLIRFFTIFFLVLIFFSILLHFSSFLMGTGIGTIIFGFLDLTFFSEYKNANKELHNLEALKFVLNDLLVEAQNHLENLKICALLEEKQREEIITKKIDDSKQINQLRNAFLKMNYLAAEPRGICVCPIQRVLTVLDII